MGNIFYTFLKNSPFANLQKTGFKKIFNKDKEAICQRMRAFFFPERLKRLP